MPWQNQKPNLIYTVALDQPGEKHHALMAKMLVSSLLRTYFTGQVVIFRSSPEPIFRLERKGLEEVFIDAEDGYTFKYRVREQIPAEDYEWVLFLDCDILALRNIDHLLDVDDVDILYAPEPGRLVNEPAGLEVRRQPAVDGKWLKNNKGYPNKHRAALAMTKRLALRRARFAKADAVLIFEDDVKFHPEFHERVAALRLPNDWGLFYFGCLHVETPIWVGEGLVRVKRAYDQHAWAVRGPYFREVARAMWGRANCQHSGPPFSDQRVGELQDAIPTYAAYPNLVWQDPEFFGNGNYDVAGRQVRMPESQCLAGFDGLLTMSLLFCGLSLHCYSVG